tara:strand:- start:1930 stop:2619 length:690 start_codon:yes stop_codon:yes gene_type:complete
MTALYNAIKDNSAILTEAQADDWDEVASLLNNTMVGSPVTELRNSRWLMNNFSTVVDQNTGATEADVILGTLQASNVPRVKEALALMGGEGIDLSDPQVTGMITVLGTAASWSSTITDKLAAFAVENTSLAQRAGLPNCTADVCEKHYVVGEANAAGDVVYDNRRVLLCFNDGPVNDSLTLRITPLAVVNGVEVKGNPATVGGVSTGLTGKDLQLFNDLQALVDAYLEA